MTERKQNLRRKVKEVATSERSLNRHQAAPDDRPDIGLAGTLSNLFGRYGVHPDQFYQSFRVCDHCQRIVCNETSEIGGHACFIG